MSINVASSHMENHSCRAKKRGIAFEPGLAARENEGRYNFASPSDLAEFLSLGLPVLQGFPNWRTGMSIRPKDKLTEENHHDGSESGAT